MGISVNKTLYFDKTPRSKTLQLLVAFAHATNDYKGNTNDVIKNLGKYLDIFKTGGKGSYNGKSDQFYKQYTCGRDFGIWENDGRGSDLKISKLAKDMADGKIDPEYYLSTALLNFNEILDEDSKIINPLYSLLNYMKQKNVKKIKAKDINEIDDYKLDKNETEFRNIWFSLLYSSVFFKCFNVKQNGELEEFNWRSDVRMSDKLELRWNDDIGEIDDVIEACNIELINQVNEGEEDIESIKGMYINQKKYVDLITKENSWLKNKILKGSNKIICGAPGTGKSNYIHRQYYKPNPETSKRITFHPEYTYNDFIGYIRPIVDQSNNLMYKFTPGPFTEIIGEALLNEYKVYNLIIDEINRANAAAVFGDVFQLLDRDSNTSKSEYSVHNRDIYEYIKAEFDKNGREIPLNDGEVYIPNNLNIIATMNTADQNVFIMDTAFKRRWEFEYMDIDFKDCEFKNCKISSIDIEWQKFVRTINKFMMSIECSDLMIPEDKQIGPFFAKEAELSDSKKFAYKVLMYLWDDVFKMERERVFNPEIRTFSQIVNKFDSENAIDVFNEDIKTILKDNDYIKEYIELNGSESAQVMEKDTPEDGDIYEDR